MRNQIGFSALSICFLIPIIFFAFSVMLGSYQLITKYTDTQRECRTHVLRAQQTLGKKLKDLLDLNPKAKALRAQEKALRIALLAARALPPVAAAIQVRLDINQLQQGILRGEQELIIASAQREARNIMARLPTKIKGARYSSVNFKIYKDPPLAIAPDHHTVPFFTELQTLKVDWKIPITDFIPQILLNVFVKTNYPNSVSGKCSATLVQKGNVWNPKLHLAKF